MVKWFIATILLLPLVEIAVFALVAAAIGLAPAFLLAAATSVLGALMLRWAGRRRLALFRAIVSDTAIHGFEADADGVVLVLTGLLLLLPGFLTDLVGAALLLGPVRRGCGRLLRRGFRDTPADRAVIDLAPDEWQQVPERKIDDQSDRNERH